MNTWNRRWTLPTNQAAQQRQRQAPPRGPPALNVADLTPAQQARIKAYGPNQRLTAVKELQNFRAQNRRARNVQASKQTSAHTAQPVDSKKKTSSMSNSGSSTTQRISPYSMLKIGNSSTLHSGLFDRLADMFLRLRIKSAMSTVVETIRERTLLTPSRVPLQSGQTAQFSSSPPNFMSSTATSVTYTNDPAANGANHIAAVGVFWPRRGDNSTILFDPGYGSSTANLAIPKNSLGFDTNAGTSTKFSATLADPTTTYPAFTAWGTPGVGFVRPTMTTIPAITGRTNGNLVQSLNLGGAMRITVKRGSCTVAIKTLDPQYMTAPVSAYDIVSSLLNTNPGTSASNYCTRYIPLRAGESFVYVPSFIDQSNFAFGTPQTFFSGIGTDSTWLPTVFGIIECSWSQESPEIVYETITALQSTTYLPMNTPVTGASSADVSKLMTSLNIGQNGGSDFGHFVKTLDQLGRLANGFAQMNEVFGRRRGRALVPVDEL